MDKDFLDLLFESDDEDFFLLYRFPNVVKQRIDNFEKWSNSEFLQRFRLSKATVVNLLAQIAHLLQQKTTRNNAVTPLEQLLITLRFFATGSYYITVGDFSGIHKTTTGKIIERVCDALISLREIYIYIPTTKSERDSSNSGEILSDARFPKVIAAVDGTQIRMQSPGGDAAENFRCRKGYFSLNIQATCDASLRFTDIVARWPGATHDNTIFANSLLCGRFENGEFGEGFIIGDSGYALKNYLITPLAEPQNEAQRLFNESHVRTRNVIERTFGIWKRRFPILSVGMRCRLSLSQKIIVATAILHNIAVIRNEMELPDEDNGMEIDEDGNGIVLVNEEQPNSRNQLIDYFNSLIV